MYRSSLQGLRCLRLIRNATERGGWDPPLLNPCGNIEKCSTPVRARRRNELKGCRHLVGFTTTFCSITRKDCFTPTTLCRGGVRSTCERSGDIQAVLKRSTPEDLTYRVIEPRRVLLPQILSGRPGLCCHRCHQHGAIFSTIRG